MMAVILFYRNIIFICAMCYVEACTLLIVVVGARGVPRGLEADGGKISCTDYFTIGHNE